MSTLTTFAVGYIQEKCCESFGLFLPHNRPKLGNERRLLLLEALAVQKKALGAYDVVTATTMWNLYVLLAEMADHAESAGAAGTGWCGAACGRNKCGAKEPESHEAGVLLGLRGRRGAPLPESLLPQRPVLKHLLRAPCPAVSLKQSGSRPADARKGGERVLV